MANRRRTRVFFFGALALVAALLPAGLAVGSHEGDAAVGASSVVLLTLGSTDQITWEGETQAITIRNNCTVVFGSSNPDLNADLLDITPNAGNSLGGVKDGFGVKSRGDGTGEPCGRVEADDGETISVSLGSDLASYLMNAIDVDLELKFNANVDVFFYHDGEKVDEYLDFSGSGASDDGPDSADGDNFRFAHVSSELFDTVVFDPDSGSISLEGGADLPQNGTENGILAANTSSQFRVVQTFEGEITCNESEDIEDEAVPGVLGTVTMFAMEFDPEGPDEFDWYIEDCLRKPFNESVSDETISFVPELEGTRGRYTIRITVEDQIVETDETGQIVSLTMVYDPEGDTNPTDPLLPCEGQPLDAGAEGWREADVGLLPDDEAACYYAVSVIDVALNSNNQTVGTEIWDIYFEDDPSFGFK